MRATHETFRNFNQLSLIFVEAYPARFVLHNARRGRGTDGRGEIGTQMELGISEIAVPM